MNGSAARAGRLRRGALVALVVLAGGGLAWHLARQREPLVTRAAPSSQVLIRGVRVVDVLTGTATAAADVVVSGGIIKSIEPHRAGAPTPPGTKIVEGRGRSLIPGLIDAHCHVASASDPPWDRGLPDVDLNLERLLFSGVTRVFDPGAMVPDTFELRDELASGRRLGPNFHVAGPVFTAVGGHPEPMVRQMVPGPLADYLLARMTRQIATEADASAAVSEIADLKPDFIKMAIDRIPADAPRLAPQLAQAISRAAEARGIRSVAHIGDTQDALDAGRAGVSAWIHGVYKERIPDEDVATLAAFSIPMMPTLVVFKSYAEVGRGDFEPTALERQVAGPDLLEARVHAPHDYEIADSSRAFMEMLAEQRASALDNVRRLHAAGVTIIAGSDSQSGVIHGPSLHRELALLAKAGLPPIEVLRAATVYPARFLAQSEDPPYGLIAVGKRADLVLVRGDPLQDVAAISEIEAVILNGQVLDRHPL